MQKMSALVPLLSKVKMKNMEPVTSGLSQTLHSVVQITLYYIERIAS